jgi:radical SAM superfamily enzyme YgiQ (UPF0313 family)
VRKPHGGRLRVALAFPNTYFVGMSNLGFQTVYSLFNAEEAIVCERTFLPPKSELEALRSSNAGLVTLESQTLVREFDIFALSVSFEWDYTNVLTLLRLAGIPLRAADRTPHDPIVIIGGAVTFVNPEPLALFADIIAAGEGEALIPPLVHAFREASDRQDLLRESGERTITIAPETGSDRLRRVINKTITNDEILAAADMIFSTGFDNLKLYFMIGIPTETDDDLDAIRDLALQLREIMLTHARPRGHVGRIVGSVNPLVPKPGTAYQWLPMENDASIGRKIKRMHGLMADIDNVYFNIKSERHSFYQALLSLGDRRVAPAIEAAERNGGDWRAAVKEAGIDADFYVFRDRSRDDVLPWDIIDGGMKDTFFRAEADKAMRAEWTLPPKRQKENARLLAMLHEQ